MFIREIGRLLLGWGRSGSLDLGQRRSSPSDPPAIVGEEKAPDAAEGCLGSPIDQSASTGVPAPKDRPLSALLCSCLARRLEEVGVTL